MVIVATATLNLLRLIALAFAPASALILFFLGRFALLDTFALLLTNNKTGVTLEDERRVLL